MPYPRRPALVVPGMTRKAAVAVVAVLAVLPLPARAGTRAVVQRTSIDAAFVAAADDPAKPRVIVAASVIRVSGETTSATGGGVRGYAGDVYTLCLAYSAGRVRESGCVATSAGRAVTDGVVVPTGATVRARVPVHGRRGGWIEADLSLVANGTVLYLPAFAERRTYTHDLLGNDVPAGGWASGGTVLWRGADVTGTVRTDRGLAAPVRAMTYAPHSTSVLRFRSDAVTTVADPDDVTAAVRAATEAALTA